MRKHLTTLALVLLLLVGVGLMHYPTVSDVWNRAQQSYAIANYDKTVRNTPTEDYVPLWEAARAYNAALPPDDTRFTPDDASHAAYNELLNTGNGIMGYLEIPSIGVKLSLYHGTDEAVLQVAAGHIEGSSLPTGGAGTHCVISGHTGLPSARLFTDLDQLAPGDTFALHVLDATLTYTVDQITTVLPTELDELAIDPQQDYCTLVTCTPYGVNSHRLLVRGRRTETPVAAAPVLAPAQPEAAAPPPAAPAFPLWPLILAAVCAALLFAVFAWLRRRARTNPARHKPTRYRRKVVDP